MGEKARLTAQRKDVLNKLTAVGNKIDKLQAAKNNLEAYNTTITYKLTDDATIAETYHLAGTKYETMTSDEQTLLTDLTSFFNEKRNDVLTDLEAKINALGVERDGLTNQLNSIDVSLAYAKN